MRAVIQRSLAARVDVADKTIGSIEHGLVILLGVSADDTLETAKVLARKIAHLRIFSRDGKFQDSLVDSGGGALVVSQFTLFADARKGRRPSFSKAGPPSIAEPLVEPFGQALLDEGVVHVAYGKFGADMQVHLINDGPVTINLDTDDWKKP